MAQLVVLSTCYTAQILIVTGALRAPMARPAQRLPRAAASLQGS